jgi:hypothetical protein
VAKKIRFVSKTRKGNYPDIPTTLPDQERAACLLQTCEDLATEFTLYGWDQPPTFGFLYERKRRISDTIMTAEMEFSPIPGFTFAWKMLNQRYPDKARMHWAICTAADEMRQFVDRFPPAENLVAVALVHEAWMLVPDADDEKAFEEMERASQSRTIHEHPDRVEVRGVNAVDLDGVRYGVLKPRAGQKVTSDDFNKLVGRWGSEEEVAVGGDVPNALQYFLDIITGKPTPPFDQYEQLYDYEERKDEFIRRHKEGRDE